MSHTVVGMFDNASEAKNAVEQLISKGFSAADVDNSVGSTNDSNTNFTDSSTTSHEVENESGIGRFFKNLFGDDDTTNKYEGVGRNAGSIVSVYTNSDEEAHRAAEILDDNGAFDIDERAKQYGYDSGGYDSGSDATAAIPVTGSAYTGSGMGNDAGLSDFNTSSSDAMDEEATSIPIIEENLEVGKRTIETGGARLRSRIIERPVEESVRLREEYVRVQRTPVDRVASEKDFDAFKEGTIEVKEHAEVPVVSKTARVVEEVSLNKEVTQRQETINDTVRSTEVEIDDLPATDKNSIL